MKKILKKNSKIDHILLLAKIITRKAIAVSKKHHNYYVIEVNQICVFRKKILNKPLNKNNAIIQLGMLSGYEHDQISGCSICLMEK